MLDRNRTFGLQLELGHRLEQLAALRGRRRFRAALLLPDHERIAMSLVDALMAHAHATSELRELHCDRYRCGLGGH